MAGVLMLWFGLSLLVCGGWSRCPPVPYFCPRVFEDKLVTKPPVDVLDMKPNPTIFPLPVLEDDQGALTPTAQLTSGETGSITHQVNDGDQDDSTPTTTGQSGLSTLQELNGDQHAPPSTAQPTTSQNGSSTLQAKGGDQDGSMTSEPVVPTTLH
ncbi:hypothetical protein GN956_G26986 [Arapaima gigas]